MNNSSSEPNSPAGPVAAADLHDGIAGCNEPSPVLGTTEECREAGARVKARPAKPVDRAVATDQCCGLAVANERVVLDA